MDWAPFFQTLMPPALLTTAISGLLIGFIVGPVLLYLRDVDLVFAKLDDRHALYLASGSVLLIGLPVMGFYFVAQTLQAWLNADDLWPRTLGRGVGVELFVIFLALGIALRGWWMGR